MGSLSRDTLSDLPDAVFAERLHGWHPDGTLPAREFDHTHLPQSDDLGLLLLWSSTLGADVVSLKPWMVFL